MEIVVSGDKTFEMHLFSVRLTNNHWSVLYVKIGPIILNVKFKVYRTPPIDKPFGFPMDNGSFINQETTSTARSSKFMDNFAKT